ncbi:hypothetical protein [Spirosoma agri]
MPLELWLSLYQAHSNEGWIFPPDVVHRPIGEVNDHFPTTREGDPHECLFKNSAVAVLTLLQFPVVYDPLSCLLTHA